MSKQKELSKLVVITENKDEIMKIAEASQKTLSEERGVMISDARAIPTIAYDFFEQMFYYLARNKSVDTDLIINFQHLFDVGVTCRESEDGEKDANFVPVIAAGQMAKTIIKSDEQSEENE